MPPAAPAHGVELLVVVVEESKKPIVYLLNRGGFFADRDRFTDPFLLVVANVVSYLGAVLFRSERPSFHYINFT